MSAPSAKRLMAGKPVQSHLTAHAPPSSRRPAAPFEGRWRHPPSSRGRIQPRTRSRGNDPSASACDSHRPPLSMVRLRRASRITAAARFTPQRRVPQWDPRSAGCASASACAKPSTSALDGSPSGVAHHCSRTIHSSATSPAWDLVQPDALLHRHAIAIDLRSRWFVSVGRRASLQPHDSLLSDESPVGPRSARGCAEVNSSRGA